MTRFVNRIIKNHCTDEFAATKRVGRYLKGEYKNWSKTTKVDGPAGTTTDDFPTKLIADQCLIFREGRFFKMTRSRVKNRS